MKTFFHSEIETRPGRTGQTFGSWAILTLAVALGLMPGTTFVRAQNADIDSPGAEVLTRGPVHEAFAGVISFNAEPGIVVPKAPPENIEEIPPDEKPEGDNVAWVPGYWSWDDERNDFIWISGIWRTLPPGREWIGGYWRQTSQGYQWTSGYWADESNSETSYLPPPPQTVEAGPNVAAPSPEYNWIPGCWIWYRGHYAWRPGYWNEPRPNWDWIPASYVWTPRGYLFVDGYWDYPAERRGIIFAPVYFESEVYSRRSYHYSPRIVISLNVFSEHLFLRPRYHHYYFGDYYAPRYGDEGIYASFTYQSSRHGYDPFYSRQRWEHRQDREWEHHVAASYRYRRENEAARPPRTWAAQRNITTNNVTVVNQNTTQIVNQNNTQIVNQTNNQVAVTLDQVAKRKENPVHFQKVSSTEKQSMLERTQAVQKSREQRRSLEAKAVQASAEPTAAKAATPEKVQLPRSPIAAKPVSELKKEQAPPTPPRAPKPEPKAKPESTDRQTNREGKPAPVRSRQPDAVTPPATRAGEPVPSATRRQPEPPLPKSVAPTTSPEKESQRKAPERKAAPAPRPDNERPKRVPAEKAKEETPSSNAQEIQRQQSDAAERQKASTLKAQQETTTAAENLKRQRQAETTRQNNEAAARAAEAQRSQAREREKQTQAEAAERQNASARKAQAEAATQAENLKRQQQEEAARQGRETAAKAMENAQRNKPPVDEQTRRQMIKPAPKKLPSPPEKDSPPRDKDKPDKDDK